MTTNVCRPIVRAASALSSGEFEMSQAATGGDFITPRMGSDELFSALLRCTRCGIRRFVSVRRGELLLLQRDGSLSRDCPECQSSQAHRLIRIHVHPR